MFLDRTPGPQVNTGDYKDYLFCARGSNECTVFACGEGSCKKPYYNARSVGGGVFDFTASSPVLLKEPGRNNFNGVSQLRITGKCKGKVKFYSKPGGMGQKICEAGPGTYPCCSVAGCGNDRIGSWKVPGGGGPMKGEPRLLEAGKTECPKGEAIPESQCLFAYNKLLGTLPPSFKGINKKAKLKKGSYKDLPLGCSFKYDGGGDSQPTFSQNSAKVASMRAGFRLICGGGKKPKGGCPEGSVRVIPSSPGGSIGENQPMYPQVRFRGSWWHVCGHYFWDSDDGAQSVCKAIGFKDGKRISERKDHGPGVMVMPVGKCNKGESLVSCTGAWNNWAQPLAKTPWGGHTCQHGQVGTSVLVKCTGLKSSDQPMLGTQCPEDDGSNFWCAGGAHM